MKISVLRPLSEKSNFWNDVCVQCVTARTSWIDFMFYIFKLKIWEYRPYDKKIKILILQICSYAFDQM